MEGTILFNANGLILVIGAILSAGIWFERQTINKRNVFYLFKNTFGIDKDHEKIKSEIGKHLKISKFLELIEQINKEDIRNKIFSYSLNILKKAFDKSKVIILPKLVFYILLSLYCLYIAKLEDQFVVIWLILITSLIFAGMLLEDKRHFARKNVYLFVTIYSVVLFFLGFFAYNEIVSVTLLAYVDFVLSVFLLFILVVLTVREKHLRFTSKVLEKIKDLNKSKMLTDKHIEEFLLWVSKYAEGLIKYY